MKQLLIKDNQYRAKSDFDEVKDVVNSVTDKTLAELEKEGLKGEVIINHSGSAKVIFGHYDSEEDAFRNLNIMKDNERFRMGWVTKIER